MKLVIACDDSSLLAKIFAGLHELGIECPGSQQISLESAREFAAAAPNGAVTVVILLGSQQFGPAEFALLKQVCAEKRPHVKVVAVGPAHTPSTVLQAIHSGASDFLDIKGDLRAEIRLLIERLRAATQDHPAVGRLFTIVAPAGGSGASLLAVNLAAVLAKRQSACGLLDLHLRGGDLATLLKCKPRHTLLSLAAKASQLDRTMFDQSIIKHESGIHLLASPEPFSNYRQINPQLIQQTVQFARVRFPSVVVELEDMEHSEQVRTLAASDRIIIPLRLDFVALCRTKLWIDYLWQSKVSRERITLVACRVGQPNELPVERMSDVLGLPIKHCIRHDPAAVNAAVNLGMPVVLTAPNAKASQAITRLADSLIQDENAVVDSEAAKRSKFSLKSVSDLFGFTSSTAS
jgi:pilus assembly protein CpaE